MTRQISSSSKSFDISAELYARPPLLAYVYFEEEPAGEQRPSCSPATKRGGSRPTWRSCQNFYNAERVGERNSDLFVAAYAFRQPTVFI
jgi:hypothetical protein